MRTYLGIAAAALVACAPSAPAPEYPDAPPSTDTPPPTTTTATSTSTPSPAPVDPSSPTATAATEPAAAQAPAGPEVVIGDKDIMFDGEIVGSVEAIARSGKMQKVDALFDALKSFREAENIARQIDLAAIGKFTGIASVKVAPATPTIVFVSVFQTTLFSGYSNVFVAVNGRYLPTRGQVPAPPCGPPGDPCHAKSLLHAQGDQRGWRLQVPREKGAIERSGEGANGSSESFRSAMVEVVASQPIDGVVLHIPRDTNFAAIAPFLEAAVKFQTRSGLPEAVIVSIRELDITQGAKSP